MKKKSFFQAAPLLIVLTLCLGGLPEGHAVPIFGDVSPTYWSYVPIETLAGSGITQGCSAVPPLYCPESQVLRSQMAVFLERSIKGSSFQPPPAAGIFADVPPDYWASGWIEQLFHDAITLGCAVAPLRYCPESPVNRAEMAVFIRNARFAMLPGVRPFPSTARMGCTLLAIQDGSMDTKTSLRGDPWIPAGLATGPTAKEPSWRR